MGPPLAALGAFFPRNFAVPSQAAGHTRERLPETGPAWASCPRASARGGVSDAKPALPLEMEWHMKRLCQRCRVSGTSLDPTLILDPDPGRVLLLWRDTQWRRPPSKR